VDIIRGGNPCGQERRPAENDKSTFLVVGEIESLALLESNPS
jgi:hypothetical protein